MTNDLNRQDLEKRITELTQELSYIRDLSDNLMKKLYAVMNNSRNSLIIFLDKNLNLDYYNVGFSDIFGYNEVSFSSDIHQDNINKIKSAVLEYQNHLSETVSIKSYTKELVLKNIDSQNISLQLNISKIYYPEDKDKGYLIFGHNITQIKNMKNRLEDQNNELVETNKKLEEVQSFRNQFYNNITHELRTPLSGILGVTHLIKPLVQDNEALSLHTEFIEDNTKNLLTVINQLLDIAKIDSGKLPISLQKIPLILPINDMENLAKSLLAKKPEVKFIKNVETPERLVYTDYTKMRQILTNIIGNAVKFTKEGEIEISAKIVDNKKLRIVIRDTGIGIKEEYLDKIFEPFIQADSSNTREFKGTGLGLAITKKLVELLSGEIKVDSKFGEGCKVILDFKLLKKEVKNGKRV